MIYVSSSCIKANTIRDSIESLVNAGFTEIELSGGTQYYEGIEDDLLELKEKYNLALNCHNYFPPPIENFVLNLASLDQSVNSRSLNQVKNALFLSQKLGATKFAFHAGFLIHIPMDEIGKAIRKRPLFDREQALQRFSDNYLELVELFSDIDIYVENNVISKANYENYDGVNPLFCTDSTGLKEHEFLGITPLLDVAHLKVSCNTLGLDFETELRIFEKITDYIHISDNNGLADTNSVLKESSELYKQLSQFDFSNKTITLEIYDGIEELRTSYKVVEKLKNE